MHHNADLISSLKEKVDFLHGGRLQKLKQAPLRMFLFVVFRYIAKHFPGGIKIKARTFWGEDMHVCFPDSLACSIYHHQFTEEETSCAFAEYLYPGMTALDIGAHFGFFTLLAARLVGEKGRVHAFEPTPETFRILESNTFLKKNIRINNCAVFSSDTSLYLNDYGNKHRDLNSLYDLKSFNALLPQPRRIKVSGITVDRYIRDNRIAPDFIKIDAESAEYEIVLGMEETIKEFHPLVLLEAGYRPEKYLAVDFLIERGYIPYTVKERKIIEKRKDLDTVALNIIFLPGKSHTLTYD